MAPLLIFIILSILSLSSAENRAHGLDDESPMSISPSAYTFFHPNMQPPNTNALCGSSECSSLSLAVAAVQANPAHEISPSMGSSGLAARGIVGIPLVFVFACLITAGVYYVVIKRQAKLHRADPLQQQGEV